MRVEYKKSMVTGTINFKVGDRVGDVFDMDTCDTSYDDEDVLSDSIITSIEYNSHDGVTIGFKSEE